MNSQPRLILCIIKAVHICWDPRPYFYLPVSLFMLMPASDALVLSQSERDSSDSSSVSDVTLVAHCRYSSCRCREIVAGKWIYLSELKSHKCGRFPRSNGLKLQSLRRLQVEDWVKKTSTERLFVLLTLYKAKCIWLGKCHLHILKPFHDATFFGYSFSIVSLRSTWTAWKWN